MTAAIFRKLEPYIPTEDSLLALTIRYMVMLLRTCKVFAVLGGVLIIYQAALLVGHVKKIPVPPGSVKVIEAVMKAFVPLFLKLISHSLDYLWLPMVFYLSMSLLIKTALWRKFWCLVGFSWCLLQFIEQSQRMSWKEYHLLPLMIVQGYLFLLWLLPQEIWNIIGLTISLILGLLVFILPDLPTALDDFGLFGAILVFFLGYINLLAALIQRAAQRL